MCTRFQNTDIDWQSGLIHDLHVMKNFKFCFWGGGEIYNYGQIYTNFMYTTGIGYWLGEQGLFSFKAYSTGFFSVSDLQLSLAIVNFQLIYNLLDLAGRYQGHGYPENQRGLCAHQSAPRSAHHGPVTTSQHYTSLWNAKGKSQEKLRLISETCNCKLIDKTYHNLCLKQFVWTIYQWLSTRMQYLHCFCTRDNAVLH